MALRSQDLHEQRLTLIASEEPSTWFAPPPIEGLWNPEGNVEAWFLPESELTILLENREPQGAIEAELCMVHSSEKLEVSAPSTGWFSTFTIPPGRYFLCVVVPGKLFLSKETVEIEPSDETSEEGGPGPKSELDSYSIKKIYRRDKSGQQWHSTSRPGSELQDDGFEAPGQYIPEIPSDTPETNIPPDIPIVPTALGDDRKDKVDPFIDVAVAMPKLREDISRARRNIWIAWWAFETDFPSAFGPGGKPASRLVDDIRAALANNPTLKVYIIVWDRPWVPNPLEQPDAAALAQPQDRNRLHLHWQSNLPAGSHHQKFLLMDVDDDGGTYADEGAVLWCLGWNAGQNYWDNHKHKDPNPFLDEDGDAHMPYHDTAIRVVGEDCSNGFEDEFRRRWANNNFQPGLPARPAFTPKKVGSTYALPTIHHERTRPGPQENWYLNKIPQCGEGIYMESQYFSDNGITSSLIKRYLATEAAGNTIHAAINICHPAVQSPGFFVVGPSGEQVAKLRVETANTVHVGQKLLNRPIGGWRTANIWRVWRVGRGHRYWVSMTFPGGKIRGWLNRATSGIVAMTMVTPHANGGKFTPVYLHSKLSIIDSEYILGSTNIAAQSFLTDSESDVRVFDPIEVKRLTSLLFPELEGQIINAPNLATWILAMIKRSKSNHDMELKRAAWNPAGLLTEYPYTD